MTVRIAEDRHPAAERAHKYPPLPSLRELGLEDPAAEGRRRSGDALPKMGKFRFQLLADWINTNVPLCRVADIGGGKGVLSYFLALHGFDVTVIDPTVQTLPPTVRDLHTERRLRPGPTDEPRRVAAPFEADMCEGYDLLVGLHAHGSNLAIIEGAARHGRSFILLPCCVIDEPSIPAAGVHWFRWLADTALTKGFEIRYFSNNFKGQNIGMYGRPAPAEQCSRPAH